MILRREWDRLEATPRGASPCSPPEILIAREGREGAVEVEEGRERQHASDAVQARARDVRQGLQKILLNLRGRLYSASHVRVVGGLIASEHLVDGTMRVVYLLRI